MSSLNRFYFSWKFIKEINFHTKKIFYKGDARNSILIRLDDKLSRIRANTDDMPRINDVADIIGYCTLLLISMGVTQTDIKAFKD